MELIWYGCKTTGNVIKEANLYSAYIFAHFTNIRQHSKVIFGPAVNLNWLSWRIFMAKLSNLFTFKILHLFLIFLYLIYIYINGRADVCLSVGMWRANGNPNPWSYNFLNIACITWSFKAHCLRVVSWVYFVSLNLSSPNQVCPIKFAQCSSLPKKSVNECACERSSTPQGLVAPQG